MKSLLLPALLWWLLCAAHYPATSGLSSFPLPAEITSFTGKCSDGHIRLGWTTRTETNTRLFRIEASADGEEWHLLGTMRGAGHSTRRITYRFVMPGPRGPYFRLVVVDTDGAEHIHPAIEVRCGATARAAGLSLEVVPAQTTDLFEVRVYGLSDLVPARLEIIDAEGRLQAVSPLFGEKGRWSRTWSARAMHLPAGKYVVRVRQDGKVARGELVVRLPE